MNYMTVINLNSADRVTRFSRQWCWRFKSSGVLYCVAGCTVPSILQKHNAFFFTVKQSKKMKALWSFEKSGATQPTNSTTFHSTCYTHKSTHHYYPLITITWPSRDVQSLFWLTGSLAWDTVFHCGICIEWCYILGHIFSGISIPLTFHCLTATNCTVCTVCTAFTKHHNKTAHHILWNTVQASTTRFFFYLQNVIQFYSININIISFTSIRKVWPSLLWFHETHKRWTVTHTHTHTHTHTPYIEFHTNQTITEVKITDSNSIMPAHKVQLSVRPFPSLTPT